MPEIFWLIDVLARGQQLSVENIGFGCIGSCQRIYLNLSETESNGQRCGSRSNSSQILSLNSDIILQGAKLM